MGSAATAATAQVTLYTRGKSEIAPKIADEVTYHWQMYKAAIKHIKGDRKDYQDLKRKIAPEKFDGEFEGKVR